MARITSKLPGWPLMLDEAAAAAYVSLTLRDLRAAVGFGDLPAPQRLAGKLLWSRPEIDASRDAGRGRSPGFDPIAAAIARAAR